MGSLQGWGHSRRAVPPPWACAASSGRNPRAHLPHVNTDTGEEISQAPIVSYGVVIVINADYKIGFSQGVL